MMGSSPLARGTLGIVTAIIGLTGLIPARAGNTVARVISHASPGAHPRSRGEHTQRILGVLQSEGSSPLARGTRKSKSTRHLRTGLIPARAGNTC